MAGQVPMTPPPAFAQGFANNLNQQAQARANILGSELESNSTNLGHILDNIERIAKVGGGQFTPDRLLAAYAGAKEDIIDDQYSGMADRLRLAQAEADVASTNRGNRSSGTGTVKPPKGQWMRITYPDGTVETKAIPYNETDSLPYHGEVQNGVKYEWIATPEGMQGAGTSVTRNGGDNSVVTDPNAGRTPVTFEGTTYFYDETEDKYYDSAGNLVN